MSAAVRALLLIRLDARAGHFVSVDDLAQHYGLGADQVRAELHDLAAAGQVQCEVQCLGDDECRIVRACSAAGVRA